MVRVVCCSVVRFRFVWCIVCILVCLLFIVWCMLRVGDCLLLVVCNLLLLVLKRFEVRCSLFVVRRC